MELSPEKTTITHIASGFDFLGQNIRKYHGKLLIKPSAKRIKALLRKVRMVIKANKSASAGALICQLNPLIRGWAQYHQHVVSSQTFQSVDHAIYQALWRWAKRRHSNKGVRWVKARYFHSTQTRSWLFSGEVRGTEGQLRKVRLYLAHGLHIKRHTKIKSEANPYDPEWEVYFEERMGLKMSTTLKGRRSLLYLWQRQNGQCAHCGEKITKITGWHNHHKVWRSQGGSDTMDNRVLLHPTCHTQVHHPRGFRGVPHPVRGMSGEA